MHPHTQRITLALFLLSVFSTALIATRIFWTGHVTFVFLLWNLFLAWIPFGLSLLLRRSKPISPIAQIGILGTWLLFFPNAPYILTDLVHLRARPGIPFWFDLVLISSTALTGLLLGWVSLMHVQGYLARRIRPVYTWAFVALASAGAGFGIYLGRVLRWNSWDILTQPKGLLADVAAPLLHPGQNLKTIALTLLFGAFLFAGYVVLSLIISPAVKRVHEE